MSKWTRCRPSRKSKTRANNFLREFAAARDDDTEDVHPVRGRAFARHNVQRAGLLSTTPPPGQLPAAGPSTTPPGQLPATGPSTAPPGQLPATGPSTAPPGLLPVSGPSTAPAGQLPAPGPSTAPAGQLPAPGPSTAPAGQLPASAVEDMMNISAMSASMLDLQIDDHGDDASDTPAPGEESSDSSPPASPPANPPATRGRGRGRGRGTTRGNRREPGAPQPRRRTRRSVAALSTAEQRERIAQLKARRIKNIEDRVYAMRTWTCTSLTSQS
ncbi:basic proline-rich protein-like isoform X1 [Branchiostoma floridae]|uniref:Basic proline-rich protein-like isoform X1 n=1 Tax=Branchiostoma floridae TaxID=7739 RepID=A0A9J7LBU6_BRAFL|nr:basic proline-rich protein-like isoform X1 [Branchiostoma floridae]